MHEKSWTKSVPYDWFAQRVANNFLFDEFICNYRPN